MQKLQFALDDYLHFLRIERQLAANTLSSYNRDLFGYLTFLNKHESIEAIEDIDRFHILRYVQQLKKENKSSRTIARHISSIRSFHQFALREKHAKQDPTVHLEMPKIDKKLPHVLSIEEINDLLKSPDLSKPQGLRDRAMLELLYATGMRISECIH